MTSNVTASVKAIGFNQDKSKSIRLKLEEVLNVEFLNRINHIIQFNDLESDTIKQIIEMEIHKIKQRFKEQKIKLSLIIM